MKYTLNQIRDLGGNNFVDTNIEGNPTFDWLDIVGLPQRPAKLKRNLYFATYSHGEGGWDNGYDRREIAAKVAKDTGWSLALDGQTSANGGKYIQVRSLELLARSLYADARQRTHPLVIGVTGSVGKTTAVAYLEHLLKLAGIKVVRFYSKRLTPMSLMCHYINRVTPETQVIVMEYSAYEKDHVATLAQILPPDISFFLNIYETHINPNMFRNKMEIYRSKLAVKTTTGVGYINARLLDELGTVIPLGWETFEVTNPKSLGVMPPTVRTAEIYSVGRVLSEHLNIPLWVNERAIKSFVPAENRILQCKFHGKKVYFHGETSGGSRLMSWIEVVNSEKPFVFVEELNFADEDPRGFLSLLGNVFSSDKTFVLDTEDNRAKLHVPATFVDEETFGALLHAAKGYVVYHKALATRIPDFDPEEYLVQRW